MKAKILSLFIILSMIMCTFCVPTIAATQEIADYTGISTRELNTILFNMQLKGYIDKLAGNSYISLIKLN